MAVVSVSALWLFALLAAFAFYRDTGLYWRGFAAGGGGLALGVVTGTLLNAQPNWVGALIGLIAFWRLIAGPSRRAAPWLGGLGAGLVAALQANAGVLFWPAVAVTGVALFLAMMLSRGNAANHAHEALLGIVALAAPAVGLSADLIYGWQSAAVLNLDLAAGRAPPPPGWAIAIVGLAFMAGLLKGAWRRP